MIVIQNLPRREINSKRIRPYYKPRISNIFEKGQKVVQFQSFTITVFST